MTETIDYAFLLAAMLVGGGLSYRRFGYVGLSPVGLILIAMVAFWFDAQLGT